MPFEKTILKNDRIQNTTKKSEEKIEQFKNDKILNTIMKSEEQIEQFKNDDRFTVVKKTIDNLNVQHFFQDKTLMLEEQKRRLNEVLQSRLASKDMYNEKELEWNEAAEQGQRVQKPGYKKRKARKNAYKKKIKAIDAIDLSKDTAFDELMATELTILKDEGYKEDDPVYVATKAKYEFINVKDGEIDEGNAHMQSLEEYYANHSMIKKLFQSEEAVNDAESQIQSRIDELKQLKVKYQEIGQPFPEDFAEFSDLQENAAYLACETNAQKRDYLLKNYLNNQDWKAYEKYSQENFESQEKEYWDKQENQILARIDELKEFQQKYREIEIKFNDSFVNLSNLKDNKDYQSCETTAQKRDFLLTNYINNKDWKAFDEKINQKNYEILQKKYIDNSEDYYTLWAGLIKIGNEKYIEDIKVITEALLKVEWDEDGFETADAIEKNLNNLDDIYRSLSKDSIEAYLLFRYIKVSSYMARHKERIYSEDMVPLYERKEKAQQEYERKKRLEEEWGLEKACDRYNYYDLEGIIDNRYYELSGLAKKYKSIGIEFPSEFKKITHTDKDKEYQKYKRNTVENIKRADYLIRNYIYDDTWSIFTKYNQADFAVKKKEYDDEQERLEREKYKEEITWDNCDFYFDDDFASSTVDLAYDIAYKTIKEIGTDYTEWITEINNYIKSKDAEFEGDAETYLTRLKEEVDDWTSNDEETLWIMRYIKCADAILGVGIFGEEIIEEKTEETEEELEKEVVESEEEVEESEEERSKRIKADEDEMEMAYTEIEEIKGIYGDYARDIMELYFGPVADDNDPDYSYQAYFDQMSDEERLEKYRLAEINLLYAVKHDNLRDSQKKLIQSFIEVASRLLGMN